MHRPLSEPLFSYFPVCFCFTSPVQEGEYAGGETAFPKVRLFARSLGGHARQKKFCALCSYRSTNPLGDPSPPTRPSSHKGNDGLGFKVRPKKGAAVLFYNLLEDGNGDDLALHASLPTVQGEKWLCNFWIWYVPACATST